MFEATLHIKMEKADEVKKRLIRLVKEQKYSMLPEQGPFKDGHLELVAVDKKKSEMLKYKLDPKAKFKKEAQRAGMEMNVFPASKGFYIYLTIRPYMELMDAPEVAGVTADDIEQRTDELLCRDVFNDFLPKLTDAFDAEVVSRQTPIASKARKKKVKMKRKKEGGDSDEPDGSSDHQNGSDDDGGPFDDEDDDYFEPEFEIEAKCSPEELDKVKEEAVDIRMRYDELTKEMERMRILGQKEKQRCMDQYFSAFVMDLGEVIDNLERASSDPTLSPDHAKGLGMVQKQFLESLERHNVLMIDPMVGDEFDVHNHEAIGTKEVEGMNPDTIAEVFRKGYLYKGNVIRPAQVITVK